MHNKTVISYVILWPELILTLDYIEKEQKHDLQKGKNVSLASLVLASTHRETTVSGFSMLKGRTPVESTKVQLST